MSSLEIRNIGTLATPVGTTARAGKAQGEIRRVKDAAIRAEDGRLVFVGSESDYRREFAGKAADVSLDAGGHAVVPGLVDAHTHPVWLGDRGVEIGRRLAGESYATIAAEGGGINATVRATRAASDGELEDAVRRRLAAMLAHGTTTAEAKSGYGLTVRDEIRALELLRRLDGEQGLPRLVPTLLAAHEIPPEFRQNRAEWVRLVAEEIVPRVAREKLARYCDVF
ncbi:MAG TPA: imidazolonepropionase, partial [Thermoanaerobaculia bacterium]|nr:imidazolonepropionase [Thermoanaerobaculia bacterium]